MMSDHVEQGAVLILYVILRSAVRAKASDTSQRLVRLVCKACSQDVELSQSVVDGTDIVLPKGTQIKRPMGCSSCMSTGYKGRTGIFEFVVMDDDLRDLVKAKASPRDYRLLLEKRGLRSLRRIGLERVRAGLTTLDEVVRVTI